MLVLAHEATVTGAPMNLLHLLRWVRDHTEVEVEVALLAGGPMWSRFEEVATVSELPCPEVVADLLAARPVVVPRRLRAWFRQRADVDLVYLNSISSTTFLPFLAPDPPVVVHVHELEVALRTWFAPRSLEVFRNRPDRWIAASGAVRRVLLDELALPEERVLLHHEFIDAAAIAARDRDLRLHERLRNQGDVPADAAVVLGMGTFDWRKGADLFVPLAAEVARRRREPVQFVWVGGDFHQPEWFQLDSDRQRARVERVSFVGPVADPVPWLQLADVFALTSHEDPYPLVALEAGAAATPVVTYRNGGAVELLAAAGDAAARGVADHLDLNGLVDRILALLDDADLRGRAGRQLQDRVRAAHDVAEAAPRLWSDLEPLLS